MTTLGHDYLNFFSEYSGQAVIEEMYDATMTSLEDWLFLFWERLSAIQRMAVFNTTKLPVWAFKRLKHPVCGNPGTTRCVQLWQYPKPRNGDDQILVSIQELDRVDESKMHNASVDFMADAMLYHNLQRNYLQWETLPHTNSHVEFYLRRFACIDTIPVSLPYGADTARILRELRETNPGLYGQLVALNTTLLTSIADAAQEAQGDSFRELSFITVGTTAEQFVKREIDVVRIDGMRYDGTQRHPCSYLDRRKLCSCRTIRSMDPVLGIQLSAATGVSVNSDFGRRFVDKHEDTIKKVEEHRRRCSKRGGEESARLGRAERVRRGYDDNKSQYAVDGGEEAARLGRAERVRRGYHDNKSQYAVDGGEKGGEEAARLGRAERVRRGYDDNKSQYAVDGGEKGGRETTRTGRKKRKQRQGAAYDGMSDHAVNAGEANIKAGGGFGGVRGCCNAANGLRGDGKKNENKPRMLKRCNTCNFEKVMVSTTNRTTCPRCKKGRYFRKGGV